MGVYKKFFFFFNVLYLVIQKKEGGEEEEEFGLSFSLCISNRKWRPWRGRGVLVVCTKTKQVTACGETLEKRSSYWSRHLFFFVFTCAAVCA